MRISLFRRVYLFTWSSSFMLFVVLASIFWSFQQIEIAYGRDNYAQKVNNHTSTLRLIITNDNIYSDDYDVTQWLQAQKKLSNLFEQSPSLTPRQTTIQNSIQSENRNVQRLFDRINKNKLSNASDSIKKHLKTRIIILLEVISSDSMQLSAIARDDITNILKQVFFFIIGVLSVGVIILFLGFFSLIKIFKRSFKEIKIAFSQNYGGHYQKIQLSHYNIEFKSIADEFNKMINTLNDTSVSLDVMKKLVEERTHELEKISNTDPLTKVANRRYLFERGKVEFSRTSRANGKLTLLLLDCDYFKNVNDKYGHLFGDEMLKHICTLCQQEIRSIDCLARYGGEEFIIMLPDCDLNGGVEIAQRIQKGLSQNGLPFENEKVFVTISIGVSTFTQKNKSFEELVEEADQAMYLAKKNGRNRVEVIAAELN